MKTLKKNILTLLFLIVNISYSQTYESLFGDDNSSWISIRNCTFENLCLDSIAVESINLSVNETQINLYQYSANSTSDPVYLLQDSVSLIQKQGEA